MEVPTQVQQWLVPLAYGESDSRERFNGNTGLIPDPVSMASSVANHSLQLMLNPQRLNRLAQQHNADANVPSPAQLSSQIFKQVFNDWNENNANPLHQRLLATAVNALIKTVQRAELAPESRLPMMSEIQRMKDTLAASNNNFAKQLAADIDGFIEDGEWPKNYEPEALPPGSPI